MSQIQWTVSLACLFLFVIAMLVFAVQFGDDNDAAINIADDAAIGSLNSSTVGSLESMSTNSEDTYESVMNSSINPTGNTLQSPKPFSLLSTDVFSIAGNMINVVYVRIFGGNSTFLIFTGVFLALISFITVMYIWKTLRGSVD
jgi:hypothetical protein